MWYSVLCDRQKRNETCKNCVSIKKKERNRAQVHTMGYTHFIKVALVNLHFLMAIFLLQKSSGKNSG